MRNEILLEQQRSKVLDALSRANRSMLNPEDGDIIRPLLEQVRLIDRVKPEEAFGPVQGANRYSGSICQDTERTFFTLDSSPLSCIIRSVSKYIWAGVL